ncbi:MAG: hypothetical protein HOL61_17225 [Rhodospirillaceae bacterium]|nr:hypothetical protein [Rhodospirillaceae bacterium]MBT5566050.1 hypothetical protein [Rhodospirillaceae bacterium]MBT6961175.1 hypothetical protein [Rhodospirillaceae bacterium]
MAFSISSITDLLKRNKKAQDPFGGDDEDFYDEDVFDDESDGGTLGRKIALGFSGLLGVLIVGFITTAIMTADETAGPVSGAIPTEIAQVVSEDGEVLQTFDIPDATTAESPAAPAAGGPIALPPLTSDAPASGTAMPTASTAIVDDSTAETDKSSARRPWLGGGAGAPTGTRLTREQPMPGAAPGRAASMDDLLRQSRENNPTPRPVAQMPASDTADVPTGTTDMAAIPSMAEDNDPQEAMPLEQAPIAPTNVIPMALPDPGLVPGAPRRFAQSENADAGPAIAGGAPRLTEPVLPPTDSRAISAAPPRFTTLPDAEQLVQDPNAKARVAIIVEGLGLNRSATDAAIESLPPSVTLAFSPYARNLADWVAKAIEAGHEVLIEVPMESKRFPADDPGPLGLLTSLDQIENVERLTAILAESAGSAGVLDTSGSRFRESTEHINLVMNNLDARGLFYVQGRPGLRLGNDRVATATADIVIDERAFRAAIDARLDYIERLAKYQGSSVAVASAKPVTFERITLWLDEVGRRGVAVAPVSQVLIQ